MKVRSAEMDTIADGARPAANAAIERLRTRDKVVGEYPVFLDRRWAVALREARDTEQRLRLMGRTNEDDYRKAKAAVDAAEGEREDKVLTFKFRALAPVRYEKLLADHRPTPEQIEQAKEAGLFGAPRWNPKTFPPALIHAALVEPAMALTEVQEMCAEDTDGEALLTPIEVQEMFAVALQGSTVTVKLDEE